MGTWARQLTAAQLDIEVYQAMTETGSEEYRARRATHKFLQQGAPTARTMVFAHLPPKAQAYLTKKCRSHEEDLPVVVCFHDDDDWCLVTTRRVHWCADGEYQCLPYSEIKQVGWSAGPNVGKKRTYIGQIDLWVETDDGRVRTKAASPWFFIFDTKGVRHEVRLEVGSPLTAIWDAIDLLIRLEQIHPRETAAATHSD
jgi:hypothetical protein